MSSTVTDISAWHLFWAGGPMMVPIFLCSIGTMALGIEKFLFFEKSSRWLVRLPDDVCSCIKKNNIRGAISACDISASAVGRIFKMGLLNFGQSAAEITMAMEAAAKLEVRLMEKDMGMFLFIAQVTPLMGLLGTLIGLCGLLHAIQIRVLAMNPALLADVSVGLWQALISTAAGLFVGVCSLAAWQCYSNRLEYIVGQLEVASINLVRTMTQVIDVPLSERL
ncbi:MAG: MotA/TolQ/ExbB proton channel family protein [Candidatus Omnitrophota bacterium]